ncbi:hypothetical protein ACFV3R_25170 [Streptomyces sp. NPDC059740]|uniref:hypothetical protein n=1 Tax=Streptomyces sp. NPDC059740 TaxID=3346926 RepID=UPI00365B811A
MTNPYMHANERTGLYRLFAEDGQLLYLGIAVRPKVRWKQHALDKPWWHLVASKTVEWHDNRASALAAEEAATATEKPLYDMSWRRSRRGERRYDATSDQNAVRVHILTGIAEGPYWAGTQLSASQIAQACNVAQSTASFVLYQLSERGGPLAMPKRFRYEVTKEAGLPCPAAVEGAQEGDCNDSGRMTVWELRARLFSFVQDGADEEDLPTFAAALDEYVASLGLLASAPLESA